MTPSLTGAIHVCLLGDDPVRIMTPALDPALAPREVVLVVSPQMQERAGWLEAVLRPRGIQVTRWPIADAWDITGVRDTLLHHVIERGGEPLILNASGGTKPMALGAFDVFRGLGRPVFYVHPVADQLIWLHPDDRGTHPLADVVNLRTFFEAHGAAVEAVAGTQGVPTAYRELTDTLIRHVARFERPLGTLNYLAGSARGEDLFSRPTGHTPPGFGDLVHLFAEAGVLRPVGDRLQFKNEDARFFAQGGWLEQHVFSVLWGLKAERPIQDLARGVEIVRHVGGAPVHNELDVACLADNALYLVEAKTKHFEKGEGAEVVYKIETLRELLGAVHARAMIVSYKPLGEAHRRRARDLGIATCIGEEIGWLREQLRHLIPAQRGR
ncbi:MAG: DUF1887 family protein [Myxococcales bacterium]|nr:DUF1887 family protein [Myxococcales bacterium]MCB9523875.1 DUF1887 family protein [Myxococcales bacterium]